MSKPPSRPPAKTNLTALSGGKPKWPPATVPLSAEFQRLRDELLSSLHCSRGVIPSDVPTADLAAASAQSAQRWRRIEQKLLDSSNRAKTLPDLTALGNAAARSESAQRAYLRAVNALGIEGSRIGSRRAAQVVGTVGLNDHSEDGWGDLLE